MNPAFEKRLWRQRLGLTSAALAVLAGISPSALCAYEKGVLNLPIRTELCLTRILTRIESLVKAYPVPISLGNMEWLQAALDAWPDPGREGSDLTKEQIVQLADEAAESIRAGWGATDAEAGL